MGIFDKIKVARKSAANATASVKHETVETTEQNIELNSMKMTCPEDAQMAPIKESAILNASDMNMEPSVDIVFDTDTDVNVEKDADHFETDNTEDEGFLYRRQIHVNEAHSYESYKGRIHFDMENRVRRNSKNEQRD